MRIDRSRRALPRARRRGGGLGRVGGVQQPGWCAEPGLAVRRLAVRDTGGRNLTIAMITHEQAGDTFWDKIRAGAQDAAQGARHRPEVLQQRERARAGHAGAERDRQQGRRHRGDAVQRRTRWSRWSEGRRRRASRWSVFNSGIDDYKKAGAKMYFGSDETLAGQTVGERLDRRARGRQDAVRDPGAGLGRAGGPLRGREAGLPEHGEPAGQRRRPAVGAADDPGEAGRRTRRSTYIVTLGAPIALAAVAGRAEQANSTGQGRHLRPQRRTRRRRSRTARSQFSVDQQPYLQGYQSVDSLWLYLTNGNDHRRRPAGADRPVVRRPTNIDKILP